MGWVRLAIGAWVLGGSAPLLAGCGFHDWDCESQEVFVDEDEPQRDGFTAAALVEGLEGQRPIQIEWLGRDDEHGLSFDIAAHAGTGTLAIDLDRPSARQLNGGPDPCSRPVLAMDFTATFTTDDGALDHAFELTAWQDEGEAQRVPSRVYVAEDLDGTLELTNPQPPEAFVKQWRLDLDCDHAGQCEGELLVEVGGVDVSAPGSPATPVFVVIAAWTTLT